MKHKEKFPHFKNGYRNYIKPHIYKISGGLAGGALGFIQGNLPGAAIGAKIGYELGKLKDEERSNEIPKYLIEKLNDNDEN